MVADVINKAKKPLRNIGALLMGQVLFKYAINDDIGLSVISVLEDLYNSSPRMFKKRAFMLIKHLECNKDKYSFVDVAAISESIIKYINMTSVLISANSAAYAHSDEEHSSWIGDVETLRSPEPGMEPSVSKDMTSLWNSAAADIRSAPDFPHHLFDKIRKMFSAEYSGVDGVPVFVDDFKKCVLSMAVDFNGRYKESRRQMYSILDRIIDLGPYRKHISGYDYDGLRRMHTSFPNFSDVVSFYEGALALHSRLNSRASLDPVLLIGEPGTGKTLFSQELSSALRSDLFIESMDSPDVSHSIIGTDKHWSNSSYGRIFSSIVLGEYINPVIILDEIDKSYKFSRSGADVFHSILERKTSSIFKDKCVDYTVDASWITWIATANEEQDIPRSILDRFQVFHINPLSKEQKACIIHEKVMSMGDGLFSIEGDALDSLIKMDMRAIQRNIKTAMGRAALRDSSIIEHEDVMVADTDKCVRMGFM